MKRSQSLLMVLLLTVGALLVHGYHPFAEDAEIYLPGVERILQPELFASDVRFFDSYAHYSLFAQLIAESVRMTHLSLEVVLLLWHVLSVFLLLLGCRKLSEQCFNKETARWGAVSMIAALLSLPVAGTALYIMDQYANPRNFAAFAGIFAVSEVLRGKHLLGGFWICLALAFHPLMGVFALFLCALLFLGEKMELRILGAVLLFPTWLTASGSPAYREAARLHAFHYILDWRWYEWLGIIAPLGILWWFAGLARHQQRRRVCKALGIYGLICFCGAILFSIPGSYGTLARFQPLRGLHLLYLILFLFIGGFLGEFVLKKHVWRWLILFAPLCVGMFMAQRSLFPASAHIEWPGSVVRNPWALGFLWACEHTPVNAKFALDPNYVRIDGEDTIGFRALAQRSKLSDSGKDSGEVSMFPNFANQWWAEVQAQKNWRSFTSTDFQRLRNDYRVDWVILENRAALGLVCPYRNDTIMVCRLD